VPLLALAPPLPGPLRTPAFVPPGIEELEDEVADYAPFPDLRALTSPFSDLAIAACPRLRRWTVTDAVTAQWEEVAAMRGLEALEAATYIDDAAITTLANGALGGLRALGLPKASGRGRRSGIDAVVSGAFPSLRKLVIGGNQTMEPALRKILPGWNLPELRVLAFEGAAVEAFKSIVRTPQLARLRVLRFTWSVLTARELSALAGSTLDELGELDLSLVRFDGHASRELGAARLPALRVLGLRSCNLARLDGLEALGGSLIALDVSSNALGADAIALAVNLGLRRLDASGCMLDAASARVIASSPAARSLEELHLAYDPIGDVGALALAASPHLERLGYLRVGQTAPRSQPTVGARGMAALRERFGGRLDDGISEPGR
jgi:hypothetical protein